LRFGAGFSGTGNYSTSYSTVKADTIVQQYAKNSGVSPKFSIGIEKRYAITKKATFFYGTDVVFEVNSFKQSMRSTTQIAGAIVNEQQQIFRETVGNLHANVFMGVRYNFTPGFFASYQVSNQVIGKTWHPQYSSFGFFANNGGPIPFSPRQTLALGFRLKK
jgi:hypothetical protein